MKSELPHAPPATLSPGRPSDLPHLRAPAGLEAWRLDAGGDAFALLEIVSPDEKARDFGWRLTAAEADVARMMTAGLSNAAIAQRRGTAVRTVANQVASIFDKLGVGSRAELCALAAAGFVPAREGHS